ncbi:AraC family transcriptional regulator [Aquimarina sp. AD10]|uniref:helix-turn-helix domain-containing protein n=1 Tax=Aquimarina sp. AD10 TaxID=1714849 RepID=UPI000E4E8561|nr:AraC family transcriptional regulator [Aquimarina sp. AD10]AXT59164.1 AraC family transcriptional regulator [Aquimarina sp. AD10]RKM93871.1 helix-turn-helix domain-containing protein [Aquimarina sp. AD10]
MEIINLPYNLTTNEASTFQIFDYQTSKECFNQMVSLKQNTFSFLIEGSKQVHSNTKTISIRKSHFLLMKTGHCLMTEKLPNTSDNYRSILFFFSDKALLDFIKKYNLQNYKNQNQESIYSFEYDNFLQTFVNGLIDINRLKPELQTKLLELKFEELMIYLKEIKGVDFIFSLISSFNDRSQHFIDTVETNKLNKLTVKELSFLSNMSVSTFKREFEKTFNSTPSKWFQDKRLEHSAFLLKNKSKRPSDIFEEVGYENLSNFIQAFKTKFGVTPKQYQLN